MRMWMVNPKILCRQHLLGEHRELHALVGILQKGKSIKGYINNNLIEVHNIAKRHEELVQEIESRGYCHKTPLSFVFENICGSVNKEESIKELSKRCYACNKRKEF